MNPKTSRLAYLLGSASLLAMWGAPGTQAQEVAQAQTAQANPMEVPEQVLVTGSLIRGTVAVGVPVTNLSPQDYAQTGSLTTADLFRTVPSANVTPGAVGTQANNNIGKQVRVNIRNLDPNDGTRSLMMVDGYRFPPQGEADCTIDPSVIPALALDRIDILVDGASASYGSDAIAGVLNIILKRGYDGAVSQLRVTGADGRMDYQASQLWGRTWEGGDLTLTYEWYDFSPLKAKVRSNLSLDFSPWGLDNRTPLRSSIPATITTGVPTVAPFTSLNPSASTGGAKALGTRLYQLLCDSWAPAKFQPSLNSGLGPVAPGSAATISWAALSGNGGPNNPRGTANEINP